MTVDSYASMPLMISSEEFSSLLDIKQTKKQDELKQAPCVWTYLERIDWGLEELDSIERRKMFLYSPSELDKSYFEQNNIFHVAYHQINNVRIEQKKDLTFSVVIDLKNPKDFQIKRTLIEKVKDFSLAFFLILLSTISGFTIFFYGKTRKLLCNLINGSYKTISLSSIELKKLTVTDSKLQQKIRSICNPSLFPNYEDNKNDNLFPIVYTKLLSINNI